MGQRFDGLGEIVLGPLGVDAVVHYSLKALGLYEVGTAWITTSLEGHKKISVMQTTANGKHVADWGITLKTDGNIVATVQPIYTGEYTLTYKIITL